MPDAQSLGGLEIFKGLTDDELSQIAAVMTEQSVAAGDVIFALHLGRVIDNVIHAP